MGMFSFSGLGNLYDLVSGKGSSFFDSIKSYIDAYTGKSNYEQQKDLLQWQKDQYFYNLDYDKPINQMKRLDEAGINPHMAYAKGTINNVSNPMPNVHAPQIDPSGINSFINIAQQVQNLKQSEADILNARKQNQLLTANIREAMANADIAEHDANIFRNSKIASRSSNWLQTGFQLFGQYGEDAIQWLGNKLGWDIYPIDFSLPEKNDGITIRNFPKSGYWMKALGKQK